MEKYKYLIESLGWDYFYFNATMSLVCSFVLSYLFIPKILNVALKKGLNSIPGERDSHSGAVPHLAGVAMFYAILITISVFSNDLLARYPVLISSLLILFFIGLMDDLLVVAPQKKVWAQVMATFFIVVLFDLRINNFNGLFGLNEIGFWPSTFLTFFVFQLIINSYNLIDGIDGLSALIGILIASVYVYAFFVGRDYPMVILALAQLGALLAFLRYNLSKDKKIFMGDTGTMFLGFIISFMTVRFLEVAKAPYFDMVTAPVVAFTALLYPFTDTLRVFTLRIMQGKSPFLPDRNHIHHKLIDMGFSHFQTAFAIFSINLLILLMVYFFRYQEINRLFGLVCLANLGVYLVFVFFNLKRKKKTKLTLE